jgi:rhodanese-related sulfurtransferase
MPLPKTAFTIHGGCNCGAIRYTVNVPEFSSRPQNPYRTHGAKLDEDLRLPMVAVDHRDDCRHGTGAALSMSFTTEISTVSTTCAKRSDPKTRKEIMAEELFDTEIIAEHDVFLTFYKRSEECARWFCGRCGTNLAYTIEPGAVPSEWDWPKMLELWLGAVDREDLDNGDNLAPERQLYCDMGLGWIKRFARNGIPEHPLSRLDQVINQSRGIDEILDEARSHLKRVTPQQALAEIQGQNGSTVVLVDIRPAAQRAAEGEIKGALIIERNVLEWRFDPRCEARVPQANFKRRVIVFCQESYTSSLAARSLQELGLKNATDMEGGYRAWREAGLPDSIVRA